MPLQTLHAKEVPTSDDVTLKLWPNTKKKDTIIARDADFQDVVCRWPWHKTGRPAGRKTVTLNCYNYALQWHKP